MIVRINQFDIQHAEHYSGWPSQGRLGGLAHDWSREACAFEVLILESDEQNQPLGRNYRQTQMRHLIPEVVSALLEPGDAVVVRLDGPMTAHELLPAVIQVVGQNGEGRFAISGVEKFEMRSTPPIGSVRFVASPAQLAALVNGSAVGLDQTVRLRAFLVPENIVTPILDISEPDDDRWHQILSRCTCVLSTVRNLQSLHLLTHRFTPAETKSRLSQRLVADARRARPVAV